MEKATLSFCINKIWQILKHFTRQFHPALTSYFARVLQHESIKKAAGTSLMLQDLILFFFKIAAIK